MIDTVTLIATVPAIVALVNLLKKLGVPAKVGLLLAVVFGVGLSVAQYAFAGNGYYEAAASGLLLGLAAAGLYELVPGDTSQVLKQIMEGPEDDRRVTEYIIDGKVYAGADNEQVPPGSYIREYHGDVKPERAAGDLVI